MSSPILYCHCAYAKVVPVEVKQHVLQQLTESGQSFDAVADLCEMSAKGDPTLKQLAGQSDLQIVACYPRAVKWLFSSAGVALPADAKVLNMREQTGEEIVSQLFSGSSPVPAEVAPAVEGEHA
jgi:hypothetical protein